MYKVGKRFVFRLDIFRKPMVSGFFRTAEGAARGYDRSVEDLPSLFPADHRW